MSDIHNTQQRLESAVKNLEQSDYSKEELQALKDFKLQLESEGLGAAKVQKYLSNFSTLSENIDFDLLDPDKKDLKQLVVKINNNRLNDHEYSVWSIKEFKVTLNRFYKWHLGEDTEILDFMTTQVSESDKPMTSPDELPQPSDVKKLVNIANFTIFAPFIMLAIRISINYKLADRLSYELNYVYSKRSRC